MESACSTPYTSAPSSPARSGGGYFYSAPTSPVHFMRSYVPKETSSLETSGGSFEFDFGSGSMSSADELFLDGQIRPTKFPLSPLVDLETEEEEEEHQDEVVSRGRDLVRNKSRSIHRKTRSLSPVPSTGEEVEMTETTPSSSSTGRTNSKKWVFLKDLIYRSKSEGSNRRTTSSTNNKFWSLNKTTREEKVTSFSKKEDKKPVNGVSKRRGVGAASAHEVHYTARRAEKEEMKKKTYLPYRQGLLGGCLGFSSKGYYYYGAFKGFSRSLNPVSSR